MAQTGREGLVLFGLAVVGDRVVGGDVIRGTYRRNGEGDYRCTPEEIEQMLAERERVCTEPF